MDFNDGGSSSEPKSKSSAAEAAREKVLAVYNSAMQSLKKFSKKSDDNLIAPPIPGSIYSTPEIRNPASAPSEPIPTQQDPTTTAQETSTPESSLDTPYLNDYDTYDTAPQETEIAEPSEPAPYYDETDETSSLKDTPINQSAVNAEWQQYHSAWQNYYQNYYSEYYAKAAQNYLETEKLKNERIANGKVHKKHRTRRLVPVFIVLAVVIIALFLQYNRLLFAPIMAYVAPDTDSVSTSIEAVDPSITQAVSPEPRLIIPKLNIDVPVAFGINYNEVMSAMNHGVAQFMIPGANAMPGKAGNLVLSGHSAGDIYSSNPYKFIFSGLERLEPGDLIYVNYESVRYTYTMSSTKVVEPSDVQALMLGREKPMLTLITCTPLGTSRYRLLVFADQISPEYSTDDTDSNAPDASETNPDDSGYSMPANEPSVFESIWQKLFGN